MDHTPSIKFLCEVIADIDRQINANMHDDARDHEELDQEIAELMSACKWNQIALTNILTQMTHREIEMLTINHKRIILEAMRVYVAHAPENVRVARTIIEEVTEDLRRHQVAHQRSSQRNAAKRSRRDQRGPNL